MLLTRVEAMMGNSTISPKKRDCTVSTSRQPTILGYQILIFDGSILTLYSFNITCKISFVTFGGSLTFFLIFDDSILTLCSSNITCNSFFVTFDSSLFFSFFFFFFFFSHLIVSSSHCAVSTRGVHGVVLGHF